MKQKNITRILLGIYLILLVWIILFKLVFNYSDLKSLIGSLRSINLIPFYYPNKTSFHLKEVIDNILIFIPLGVILKMLDIKHKTIILTGVILSFVLETMQFIFSIGASDITDIITNTTGTIIGLTFYIVLNKIIKNDHKLINILNIIGIIGLVMFILLATLIIINN